MKEERKILRTIKRRNGNWIGHILRRNCPIKHIIIGKIEGVIELPGRREGMSKQLVDNLRETTGYCK